VEEMNPAQEIGMIMGGKQSYILKNFWGRKENPFNKLIICFHHIITIIKGPLLINIKKVVLI
jgi:hypothetical protein